MASQTEDDLVASGGREGPAPVGPASVGSGDGHLSARHRGAVGDRLDRSLDADVRDRLHGAAGDRVPDLHPAADPATSAYTNFLLAVAALEPVGHIAAAMTPCMRLYAYLGQQLAPQTKPESPYREWVMTYSSAQFEALARRLEVLLDRYGGDHHRLAVLYQQAMELELRFFDAAGRWEKP